MSVRRILRNTAALLPITLAPDGTPTDATGNVTVTIVDAAGDTIVATTNATDAAGTGNYSYTLAPQTALNLLTITWAGTLSGQSFSLVDQAEVVGEHLFTEVEARAFHASQFSDTTTFSDASIAEARDRISDEFAQICGVSFVPRYERERVRGTGTSTLWLKWPKITAVQAATLSDSSVTVSDITTDPLQSCVYLETGSWSFPTTANPLNVTIDYEHGYTAVPADIKRAALMLLRYQLQPDVKGGGIPDAAVTITDQFGNMSLLDDGSGSTYSLRFVRDTLNRYRLQPSGFA